MRLVRRPVHEGGPLVCVIEAVRTLRLEERPSDAVRSGMVVRLRRRVERTRLRRCRKFGHLAGLEFPSVRTWRSCQAANAGSGR